MAQSAKKLQLIDPATGEITETACPHCQQKDRTIHEWQRKYNGVLSQLGNMRADRAAEAKASRYWPQAITLFNEWMLATGKTRSRWTADRFWLAEPYLREDGFVVCRWAVYGVAHEPMTKELPSGLVERYDDWETCFKKRSTFERMARRGWFNPEARKAFPEAVRFK